MSVGADDKGGRAANPWAQWLNGLSGLGQGAGGDLYKQIVKDWEGWFGTQFEKLARSEAFLEQVGRALETTLSARTQGNRWLEQSIKAMRLPTTGDLEEMHKRLDGIDRRLDAIGDRLAALEGKAPAPPTASAAGEAQAPPESPAARAPKRPAPKRPASDTAD